MVKLLALCMLLSACAADGVVLVLRERPLDAEVAALDASAEASLDATRAADVPAASAPDASAPAALGVCRIGGSADGFYDAFPDAALAARWLVADGLVSFAGNTHSFRRDNVAIENSQLVLQVHGDRSAAGRSAAAIATRDLFASGTYQVQGRFAAAGVELALWWRRDDESEGTLDMASPGLDGTVPSYLRVRMRSRAGAGSSENQFAVPTLDDGADHILRFDRYTTASPAAAFWVDDQQRWITNSALPTARAGRLWIVAWPRDPNFDSGVIRITNAFVTPFGNSGDRCSDGELGGPGLVPP